MNLGISSGVCISFLGVWAVAIFASNEALASLMLVNGVIQMVLFISVACIPFLITDRMSYVDIAWSSGLAIIGILILLMGDGDFIRKSVVGCVYLLIGLRMFVGALIVGRKTGIIFKTELPRYVYRRMMLEKSYGTRITPHSLVEIMAQALANISVFALPGFVLAINDSNVLSTWEIVGAFIWVTACILESTADVQKMLFLSKNKEGVCDVGLWRYSRHPNYFFQWLVWTGLVIAAIPSLFALKEFEILPVWFVLIIAGMGASPLIYITLVYLTGAIPAEYYSVRKRSEYKNYQERTSMFFPWFPGRPEK